MRSIDFQVITHRIGAGEKVLFFPRHMFAQSMHVPLRILDYAFSRNDGTRNNRLNVGAQPFAEFGDFPVIDFNLCEPRCQFRTRRLHGGVDDVFLRMVRYVRVDGHVTHDVAQQPEVRRFVRMVETIDLPLHQIEQNCHIAMVQAQLLQQFGGFMCHDRSLRAFSLIILRGTGGRRNPGFHLSCSRLDRKLRCVDGLAIVGSDLMNVQGPFANCVKASVRFWPNPASRLNSATMTDIDPKRTLATRCLGSRRAALSKPNSKKHVKYSLRYRESRRILR